MEPKPVPLIVTEEPTGPAFGETPVTESASSRVNGSALLVTPFSTTVTEPLVALDGTTTVMLVSDHEVKDAEMPLN